MKRFYSSYTWDMKTKEKLLYLTFDDGPHEQATPFVLDALKKYNAKATFFCIGKNVSALPSLYNRILEEGHSTGNHTYNHLNGWKTADADYLRDVVEASKYIESSLFRPPYGRIRSFQAKNIPLVLKDQSVKIVMWDVLSGDFDQHLTKEHCLQNVILNARNGSIIVFHDSTKALPLLEYCLPRALEFFAGKGFRFERLINDRADTKNKEVDIAL
jgi:peptidoglycan-N-acetylglucosamine deacetylase